MFLMSNAELDDYCWLLEPQAASWLERLTEQPRPAISLLKQLKQDVGNIRASLLNQQVVLRKRAQQKFSAASKMFFTDQALQQATDELVARYKAHRFVGLGLVADLCCGLGGDLAALASRGPVVGVDRDPIVAWLAQHNAQAVLGATAVVRTEVADVCEFDLQEIAGLHLDPDRRSAKQRYSQLVGYEPGLDFLEGLVRSDRPLAVKLAPAAVVPDTWSSVCEKEWLASRGECRQQVLWSGSLAVAPGEHAATCVSSTIAGTTTVRGKPHLPVPEVVRCCRYLYEPNPAILAAQLVGAVAEQYELGACWPQVAYLTSDHYYDWPGFACFEVLEVLPFDRKRVKALLRQRKIGQVEVKKRGTQVEPAQLQRQLQGKEAGQATLLLAGTSAGVTAVLAQRKAPEASESP